MTTCCVLLLSAAIPLDSSTFLPLWAGFSLIWAEVHTTLGEGPGSDRTMYGAHTGLESPEEALRPQILPRVDHQGAPTCGVGMLHPRSGSLIAELQVHRSIFVVCRINGAPRPTRGQDSAEWLLYAAPDDSGLQARLATGDHQL